MIKNILITGGAGFIGSNLANKLADNKDYRITVVDNLATGFVDNLLQKPNINFIKADINNLHEVAGLFYVHKYDYVFHYAAVVGVSRTLENPINVLKDIDGIKNVLELSKITGVKRVFFSSSSEVYGEPVHMPQNEELTPLNSRLPYAIVKNVGEAFVKSYHQEHGLEYTIFRFFNTYGPNQSEDFVMNRFINAALNGNDITIYGDGSQTRTFCFVDDNTDVAIISLDSALSLNEVINVGNDREVKIIDLAKIIVDITGSKSKIVHLPALKEGDMTRRQPDISKMKKILNRDLVDLEEGIRMILKTKKYPSSS